MKAQAAHVSLLALASVEGFEVPEDCPPVAAMKAVVEDANRLTREGGRDSSGV